MDYKFLNSWSRLVEHKYCFISKPDWLIWSTFSRGLWIWSELKNNVWLQWVFCPNHCRVRKNKKRSLGCDMNYDILREKSLFEDVRKKSRSVDLSDLPAAFWPIFSRFAKNKSFCNFSRTTILPQRDALVSMLDRLKAFHVKFMQEYS